MAQRQRRTSVQKVESKPTAGMTAHVFKASGGSMIVPNRREMEDGYLEFYKLEGRGGLIEPPYNLKRLEELVQTNNTLGPCVEAMVNNIDGTGYEIERRDGDKMDDADQKKVQIARDFFNECYPRMSFQTLRKRMRRDLEVTGNGYMEVMRNAAGELVFVGPLESKNVRVSRLDGPVVVEDKITRNGKEETVARLKRERRYVQTIGEKLVWFAEYGASRDLNKLNGEWVTKGSLPADQRASEIIVFGVDPDITTPYSLPRWIAQAPSVLASRAAEEHNLEFFDSGGVPPYLVIVQGGQLAEKTVEAVRDALNQKGAHARIQVIEAFSTSGSLDSAGNVQVKVERFGAEKSQDPMFAQFDKDCEERVRKAFRLPPIMIGKSQDYNYASAQASYLVAEAQVFKPERDEFDEIINATILKELLGTMDYVYRSKPISIVDAATQLSACETAISTNMADPEHIITLLGEIAGVDFKLAEEGTRPVLTNPQLALVGPDGKMMPTPQHPSNVTPISAAKKPKPTVAKAEEMFGLERLIGCTLAVMAEQAALDAEA